MYKDSANIFTLD